MPSPNAFAAALSLGSISFTAQNAKPAKLTLTPHHLYYLLSRFEEMGIDIGSMNVRLENIHAEQPAEYVSFLNQHTKSKVKSDRDSIHSISSIRSVMSNMSSFWSNFGMPSSARLEKARAQLQVDLKYLYSAFTKIPCLRLSPDNRARLIGGFEEFPFDTAVPLVAFKNVSALEICDLDFRQFFGWDRLADQLRSLSIKRGHLEDPLDLIVHVVLDDMNKRRRRSSKQSPLTPAWPASPPIRHTEFVRINSIPGTPETGYLGTSASPRDSLYLRNDVDVSVSRRPRNNSTSPTRPKGGRQGTSHRHVRATGEKMKRSGSGSSNSSTHSLSNTSRDRSSSNLLAMGILPASKWRFLKHLSLADNSLTSVNASGLAPLSNTLQSLDLSYNHLSEVPDCLAALTALRALNLSNCMINSLHSLSKNPLPAINVLSLRSNRITSIAGIERLLSLERLDLRDNSISDPIEMARLTSIPELHEIWVVNNPFVKSHNNYRVTIFNLFRGTPGRSEDILIDSLGPGYNERRYLRERVAESTPGLVKPVSLDLNTPDSQFAKTSRVPSNVTNRIIVGNRPIPKTTQSEITVDSNRRKRVSRRRIVDLANDDNAAKNIVFPAESQTTRSVVLTQTSSHPIHPNVDNIVPGAPNDDLVVSKQGQIEDTVLTAPYDPMATLPVGSLHSVGNVSSLVQEVQQLSIKGDAYRRKVEALKDEFGSGWLHILNEENWNGHKEEKGLPSTMLQSTLHSEPELSGNRNLGQSIIGGRTLG